MSPESKVFEKIRRVLIDDTTVKSYIEDRVYTSHISSIDRPIYPAISLHLMDSRAAENVPDMTVMTIQVDLWLPEKSYSVDDVFTLYARVRALLHGQSLTDATIGVTFKRIVESGIGPIMFDDTNSCRHMPARYAVVAI